LLLLGPGAERHFSTPLWHTLAHCPRVHSLNMDSKYIYFFENCVLSYRTIPHSILQHRCQNASAVTNSNASVPMVVFIGDDTHTHRKTRAQSQIIGSSTDARTATV
jgi:hypothetical protein